MADVQNKLTGNYYIVWLSRCDAAWRRRLADQGPYVPQHVLKKQHHADCQQIAKDLLREQLHDKMQAKRLGLKSNPGKRHSAGFASRAQQRWAFGTGQSFARKWARKTKFKGLPERATNMRRHRRNAKYAYDVIAGSRKRPQGWVGTYRTAQEARREGTRKGYSFYGK